MTLIDQACKLLREGKLVAFPTETVYGLGADATNATAIEGIFRAKGRPSTNPLIVHIADIATAQRYTTCWPETAEILAAHFWPGPLTLVLPKSEKIVPSVTAGRNTVGLRVPNHPLALELLKKFDGPLAAPSANRSNHISPTTAEHVRQELGDTVDLILDGGPCTVGIESTVLDLSTDQPTILRPGSVTREQITALIGPVQLFAGAVEQSQPAASPGQQERHYSPRTPMSRFEIADRQRVMNSVCEIVKNVAIIFYGKPALLSAGQSIETSMIPDQYASALYSTLRKLDSQNLSRILVEMPPESPQWLAVRDRLSRAAIPFDPAHPPKP